MLPSASPSCSAPALPCPLQRLPGWPSPLPPSQLPVCSSSASKLNRSDSDDAWSGAGCSASEETKTKRSKECVRGRVGKAAETRSDVGARCPAVLRSPAACRRRHAASRSFTSRRQCGRPRVARTALAGNCKRHAHAANDYRRGVRLTTCTVGTVAGGTCQLDRFPISKHSAQRT